VSQTGRSGEEKDCFCDKMFSMTAAEEYIPVSQLIVVQGSEWADMLDRV